MRIQGATVLLTGASGGLGHALAAAIAERGGRLVLTARRADLVEELAQRTGGRALVADLSDRAALEQLVEDVGEIDVLVANAAVPASGALLDYEPSSIDRAIDVNLRAPIQLARALAPAMVARGRGHLLFVGSLAGLAATPGASMYNATKFGLRGFALSLRQDLRASGVGVSLLSPGFISDAGMFADSGATLPPGVGTRTPAQVARAAVSAIEKGRAEVTVAPPALTAGAFLATVAPGPTARVQRLLGGDRVAAAVVAGQARTR